MNLYSHVKFTRVSNAVAAGVTTINGSTIDMQDFDGVLFNVGFGAITAGAATSLKIQGGIKADASDMVDIANTNVSIPDSADNQIAQVELYQPDATVYRYLRVVISRATQNSVVDFAEALQYGAKKKPPVQDATTVVATKFVQSPFVGTP